MDAKNSTTQEHAHGHDAGHEHPAFLAHHFENPKQQFEAGKLGMWLFIATEVLLFGGLFVGYSVWRGNHPELFSYSSRFLDTTMGGINTAVLILSSLTMAAAVTVAQKNDPVKQDKRPLLLLLLVLTLCGAGGFMVIKFFEYKHKILEGWVPGIGFYNKPSVDRSHTWIKDQPITTAAITPIDTTVGVLTREDIGIPENVTFDMPAVAPVATAKPGMNMSAFAQSQSDRGMQLDRAQSSSAADEDHATEGDHAAETELETAHSDEHGDAHGGPLTHPLQDTHRPRDAHIFFNIYYMMTGLHGFHVIVGGIVITWLIIRTLRGEFHRDYFTPVDLGGLYWHVVDLIWIFLFPLFYLIH